MKITVKIEMIVLLKALKLFLGRTLFVVNTRNRYPPLFCYFLPHAEYASSKCMVG